METAIRPMSVKSLAKNIHALQVDMDRIGYINLLMALSIVYAEHGDVVVTNVDYSTDEHCYIITYRHINAVLKSKWEAINVCKNFEKQTVWRAMVDPMLA